MMSGMRRLTKIEWWELVFAAVVFTAGLVLRLRIAASTTLNPDEALHAILSLGSWGEVLRQALSVSHPPLLILINHVIFQFSRSEPAARLISVLAGSLFPALLAVWMRRVAGPSAACAVLFLLTMSPSLTGVSTEVRSYALAFLFLAASLLVLEYALDLASAGLMALFAVLLYGAIVSDFSIAWFVGGVGVYALLRLKGSPRRVQAAWVLGQIGALGLYLELFRIQVRPVAAATGADAVYGWLRDSFPHRNDLLTFPFRNLPQLFIYLMSSEWAGCGLFALFIGGLALAFVRRAAIDPRKSIALAALAAVPFVLGLGGAYAHMFPFGPTRQTLVLGIFGGVGAALCLRMVPRAAAAAILTAALLVCPAWLKSSQEALFVIGPERARRGAVSECLEYMRQTIPPGSLIFTETDTLTMLTYYSGDTKLVETPHPDGFKRAMLDAGRWRVATLAYQYEKLGDFEDALALLRRRYGLPPDEPVWVVDGGWYQVWKSADTPASFAKSIQVFKTVGSAAALQP
jgi:hypothetical protein